MNTTSTRLAAALLGYVTLIILLLTLNPFYLVPPERVSFTFQSDLTNIIVNILLFLPIGFFYRLTGRQRGALLLGASLSFGIETMQLFIPARTTSIIDILANTAGAGLGAFCLNLLAGRLALTPGMVGRLNFQTPLMGLVYILIPLLWVNGLALGEAPGRRLLSLLIGICGAIVLSNVFRYNWRTMTPRGMTLASLSAGAWFFIGAGPALYRSQQMWWIGCVVMLLTALLSALPRPSGERRFEQATLKRVLPVFGLYLLLLSIWPPLISFRQWQAMLGFTRQITETSLQVLTPRIEYLAAFTVLGYLIAEWRGRSELSLLQDLPRLFGWTVICALLLEFLTGFQSGRGASLIRVVIVLAGSLFGGMIYHLLRAHIRFLLGHAANNQPKNMR